MAIYTVKIPITGYARVEVSADSEEDAFTNAFEEVTLNDVSEWHPHMQVMQGNVFLGICMKAVIEEKQEEEE